MGTKCRRLLWAHKPFITQKYTSVYDHKYPECKTGGSNPTIVSNCCFKHVLKRNEAASLQNHRFSFLMSLICSLTQLTANYKSNEKNGCLLTTRKARQVQSTCNTQKQFIDRRDIFIFYNFFFKKRKMAGHDEYVKAVFLTWI